MGGSVAHAGVCHSQVWMKLGGLQLVDVQLLADVPEVLLQGVARHAPPAAVWGGSHGSRLATQMELGNQ